MMDEARHFEALTKLYRKLGHDPLTLRNFKWILVIIFFQVYMAAIVMSIVLGVLNNLLILLNVPITRVKRKPERTGEQLETSKAAGA